MKLYALASADTAQACRNLIRLNNDCASLQWSRTIRDVPDHVLEALETIQNYVEAQLGAFCADGTLIRTLNEEEESLWHRCAKRSEVLRQILGSCVILSGKESQLVREALAGEQKIRFIEEALGRGQNLVLI